MYVYFWKDGTYSKEFDPTKDLDFGIIDISTSRKGPIVSFTKYPDTNFESRSPIMMTLDMSYDTPDIPFNAETSFESKLKMNNPNHAFNAYPLVKQMIACNDFINGQSSFMDSHIYINKLTLDTSQGKFEITEENSDKDIDAMFDHLGIRTNMKDIVKPGFCIMMNNRGYWKRVLYNWKEGYVGYLKKMRWHRALICFPDMETAYFMRYNTLLQFEKILELSIRITYSPTPEKYSTGYLDGLDSPYENEYTAVGINDILRVCIFVPQIIFIEQTLYHMDATIELNVIQSNQNIRLTITRKESRCGINTCIFNLLERMLSITMERRDVKEEYFYDTEREEVSDERHRRTV